MPDRLLRTRALTSRKLGAVSGEAEALYYRLMLVADDFGRFHGDAAIIRSACYPRGERDIAGALGELVAAGLMLAYEVEGEAYLAFAVWDQRLRGARSRFPEPPPRLAATRRNPPQPAATRRSPESFPQGFPQSDGPSVDNSEVRACPPQLAATRRDSPQLAAQTETETETENYLKAADAAKGQSAPSDMQAYLRRRLGDLDEAWARGVAWSLIVKLNATHGRGPVTQALQHAWEERLVPRDPPAWLVAVVADRAGTETGAGALT